MCNFIFFSQNILIESRKTTTQNCRTFIVSTTTEKSLLKINIFQSYRTHLVKLIDLSNEHILKIL